MIITSPQRPLFARALRRGLRPPAAITRLHAASNASEDSIRAHADEKAPSEFRRQLHILRSAGDARLNEIIMRSIQAEKLGDGAEAQVYAVPEFSRIALRINTRDAGNFAEPYRFVPIRYSDDLGFIKHDDSLGIAHAAVLSAEHPAAASLAPHEAMPNLDTVDAAVASIPFWFLKRCSGESPTAGHSHEFTRIVCWGTDARHAAQPGDESSYRLYCRLRYEDRIPAGRTSHRDRIMHRADTKIRTHDNLRACAAGTYVIPAELLIGATETCRPEYQRLFVERYRAFANAYHRSVTRIADLSQTAFDDAATTLSRLDAAHGNVRMDFEHAGNILIDFDRARIAFLDLGFSRSTYANARAGDFDLLLDALLGRGQSGHWSDILGCEDAARMRKPLQMVVAKLYAAAQKNAMQWRTRSPHAIDELGHKFQIELPERVPFDTPQHNATASLSELELHGSLQARNFAYSQNPDGKNRGYGLGAVA